MIVVTAPTGDIGSQLVDRLLDRGQPVRLIARDPSRLSEHVRGRVEVVQGSHGDRDVVEHAFAGADAVFWLVPPNPQATSLEAAYVDFIRPACDAFRRHSVGRVVGISALGRGTTMAQRAGLVTASLEMDDLIADTGVNYRALTMPSFMDNLLRQTGRIRNEGVFSSPIGRALKAPTCATRDIAEVAVQSLLDPSWKGCGHLAVLGPEDLSPDDMARTMSEVLGKPVRYEQLSSKVFEAGLLQRGMSEAFVEGYVRMMAAKNDGLDNAEARTPGNTTPTTFRQWCEEVLKQAVLV